MYPMDLEKKTYDLEFFATHVIEKQGQDGKFKLVSQETTHPQDQPWRVPLMGRMYQWYTQDNASPDAVNQVFLSSLQSILSETYRTENPQDLENLKGRLDHLIGNARAFEQFKGRIFSQAWVSPVKLVPLSPYIEQAERLKEQIESKLTKPISAPDSPGRQQLLKTNAMLQVGFNHLLRVNPSRLEGVFRLQGNESKVQELFSAIENSSLEDFKDKLLPSVSPHDIAKAMARAVRKHKPPLISADIYPFFIAADSSKTPEEKIKILKSAIGLLSPENKECLKTILNGLNTLTSMKETTLMDSANLATVWGPNLLISPEDKSLSPVESAAKNLADIKAVNSVVKFMIEKDLFE